MKILRNILSILGGFVLGSVVNMGLIMIGSAVVPAPEGVDVTTMEGLVAGMHLFTPINFLFPFLAHALGTLVGAFAAAKIAGSHHKIFAHVIGVGFLVGGIMNVMMLPSPIWYSVLDIVLCYLPMSWLAVKLVKK